MPKIPIFFEFTTTTTGGYCVDLPEDATSEQMSAILEAERAKWEDSSLEMRDEVAAYYSEEVGDISLGWE